MTAHNVMHCYTRTTNPLNQINPDVEQAGKRVAAEVELIKDEVLVLSLPHHGWRLMHVAPRDYNLATLDPRQRFVVGQRLTATLAAKPSPSTGLVHF